MLFLGRSFRYGSIVALISMSFLVGCGGSSDPAPVTSALTSRAPVRIRVTFPKTPLTGTSVKSVGIYLRDRNNVLIRDRTIERPEGGGTVEYVFADVPVGNIAVTTAAYPDWQLTPSTDVLFAIASSAHVLTNRVGGGAALNITAESGHDQVAITSLDSDIELGETVSLLATAKNAAGEDVLTAPRNWQWVSSDPSIATVDSRYEETVTVRPVRTGTVDIRATNTETGKTATFTIPVVKSSPALIVRDGIGIYRLSSRKPKIISSVSSLFNTEPPAHLSVADEGKIVVNHGERITLIDPVAKKAETTSSSLGSVGGVIQSILALPGGRVLAYNSRGFGIIDSRQGSIISREQLAIFRTVQDMTLGPDGKIYLVATLQDGKNVIERIGLAGDNSLKEEAVLRTESNAVLSSLQFLSDGKLAVLDQRTNALRLYSINSAGAEPVGNPVRVGDGAGHITVGRSIFAEGDEIVYITTATGIRRFRYNSGTFVALDEGKIFFGNNPEPVYNTEPHPAWDDVLIVPSN